jgi:DNA-binding transcriptional MerR regulator
MRIGEVSRRAAVGVETVRFYESRGLIKRPPRPGNGGYREYSDDTVRRIRFVRRAQRLGFSLTEIMELLDLETVPNARCADIRERAAAKRADVEAKIDRLDRIKDALDQLIRACPGRGPAKRCSILDAIKSGDLHLEATDKEA